MNSAYRKLASLAYRLATAYPFYRIERSNSASVAALMQALQPYHYTAANGEAVPLVRVGSVHDGGYLLPSDYTNCEALISGGISYNYDFEE